MNIGILTFQNAENYGAVLQAYALQTYLSYKFNNVYILDYNNTAVFQSYSLFNNINRKDNFIKQIIQFLKRFPYLPQLIQKKTIFHQFKTKYLNCSKAEYSAFDIIIYGSDQIWNTLITNQDMTYFGEGFNGKKIGYAVSDGNELKISREIELMVKQFYKIGCREKVLLNKLKTYNKEIDIVCDPVFLISKEEWEKKLPICKFANFILIYKIADNNEIDKEAEMLSKKLNKKIIEITYVRSLKKWFLRDKKLLIGITPFAFIGFIKNADFILTTSFHGTAFSIIFNKSFFVFEFAKRSERITELLTKLGLENRYVKTLLNIRDYKYYIDYNTDFEKKYFNYVSQSKTFLESSLRV